MQLQSKILEENATTIAVAVDYGTTLAASDLVAFGK